MLPIYNFTSAMGVLRPRLILEMDRRELPACRTPIPIMCNASRYMLPRRWGNSSGGFLQVDRRVCTPAGQAGIAAANSCRGHLLFRLQESGSAGSGGKQHRQDGGVGMADRIDAYPTHHARHGSVRLGFDPRRTVFKAEVGQARQ